MTFRMFIAQLRGGARARRDARVQRIVERELAYAAAHAGAGTGS